MKKAKFKMTGNGSGTEEVSESSCLCASVLKKDAGVVEGDFNTETQRHRGTEFKMTEIGLIPADWEVKRLGDCATIARGGSPRPIESYLTTQPDGLNWVKIGDVTVGAKYIEKTAERILPSGLSSTREVKSGDFLLSNSMSFGRPYIMKISGCIHDGWLVIQDYKNDFDQEFLYYVLGSDLVLKQYATYAAGSSVLNLNKDVVSRVVVMTPSLAEQKAIAEVLSDVDALIAAQEELIEKKRAIKQGAMQELFGMRNGECGMRNVPRRRLPGFSGEWVEKRLGEVFTIGNGKDYKHLTSGTIPVYGTGGLMTYVNDWLYDGATVCIGRKGTIDVPQYHEGKIWTVDTLYYTYDFKDVDIKFLYYLFLRIDWLSYNSATGVPSLTAKAICDIEVVLPTLAEQRAIAKVLSDMDAEISELEAQKAKFESIKQGMMQELLTGKTRLKGA